MLRMRTIFCLQCNCLKFVPSRCNDFQSISTSVSRNSSSLVHKLKSKFFPEETVPEIDARKTFSRPVEEDPRTKDYVPQRNIDEIIKSLHHEHLQLWEGSEPFSDPVAKFRFLAYCGNTLGKRVGSSYIDQINCLEDLIEFYTKPDFKSSPLQRMSRSNTKPSNLVVFEDALTDEEMTRRGHLWDRWIVE